MESSKQKTEKKVPDSAVIRPWQLGWWNSNRVMALFTFLIACAAILQVCIYRSQLDEMRIDQRAWLAIKFTPFPAPSPGATVPAPILIANVGKTVAKNVRSWVFFRKLPISTPIELRDFAQVDPASLPTGEPVPAWSKFVTGVLFPNDPVANQQIAMASTPVGRSAPEAVVWDQALADQWARGEIDLALHGKFTYDDAAGNPHWTTFCSVFVASTSGKNVSKDTSERCIAYNTVDDNK